MMFKGPVITLFAAALVGFVMAWLIGFAALPRMLTVFWPELLLGASAATVLLMAIWGLGFSFYAKQYDKAVEAKLVHARDALLQDQARADERLQQALTLQRQAQTERQQAQQILADADTMRQKSQTLIDDAERRRINATATAERRKRKLARLQASA